MPVIASQQSTATQTTPESNRSWGKYLFAAIVFGCLFLPYQYEIGGNAEVFPSERVTINMDIAGIIEEVYFNGGERVKPGTVLARIADHVQVNELNILEAEIKRKEHELEQYKTTPSIEQIKLANEKVLTARTNLQHSQEKLKKHELLFSQGFISKQAFEDVKVNAERDKQFLNEAVASLQALKTQINPNQIKVLNAELEKLHNQANYNRDKLRRTNMVTPIGGHIVTPDLQYLRNTYLPVGQKFADIENTDTVIIRVAVPEFDMQEVSIGAPFTLKLIAYPNQKFTGVVDEIETSAASADFGRIVIIRSKMANPDRTMKTGMTGYAKIHGNQTILLLAFTKALLRFVTIEIWSWLP